MTQTKSCEHCSVPFHRRRGERPYRWQERRFCSTQCANFHRRREANLPPCRKCQRNTGFRRVRGLCGTCYEIVVGTDDLFDYPRLTVPSDVAWDEWNLLKAQGLTKQQVADKLGMTYAALDRSLCRYRAKLKNQEITA